MIQEERLQANALQTGSFIIEGLKKLQSKHECIGDVRGLGLFVGVEVVVDKKNKEPFEALADEVALFMRHCDRFQYPPDEREKPLISGILISTDGLHHNVLKLKVLLGSCVNSRRFARL